MHLDYQEEYKAVKNNIDWGERIWILRPELKKNLVITYTQSSAKPSFLSVVLLGTLHTELLNDLWSWLQFIVCDGLMRLSAVNCYRKTKHPWRPDKKINCAPLNGEDEPLPAPVKHRVFWVLNFISLAEGKREVSHMN